MAEWVDIRKYTHIVNIVSEMENVHDKEVFN